MGGKRLCRGNGLVAWLRLVQALKLLVQVLAAGFDSLPRTFTKVGLKCKLSSTNTLNVVPTLIHNIGINLIITKG